MADQTDVGFTVGDRYHAEELIGRGGAGAVWRGRDQLLDRQVAIKEIRVPGDRRDTRQRALREAQAAARLRVPGVVQVFDLIEDRWAAYIIMECIDAPDLRRIVEHEGPAVARTVARWGLELLDTLEAAHDAGIVHRDVKPSNVLIESGSARLTDFGVAHLADQPGLTAQGMPIGTPAFMAPEQLRGGAVGRAADLYGLGATMYFAVEGVVPFGRHGAMPTHVAAIEQLPRPTRNAGGLRDLLPALLEPDPAARPSVEDLRARLRAATDGAQLPSRIARPTARPGRADDVTVSIAAVTEINWAHVYATVADRPPRRWPARALSAVAAVVLLVALTGFVNGVRTRGVTAFASATSFVERTTDAAAPASRGPASAACTAAVRTAPGGSLTPMDGGSAVPADWSARAAPDASFIVRHPADWRVEGGDGGGGLELTDPASTAALRIGRAGTGSSAALELQRLTTAFTDAYDTYEVLRDRATTYRGAPAVVTEFRATSGGAQRRGYRLGARTGTTPVVIELSSCEGNWAAARELWPGVLAGYGALGA